MAHRLAIWNELPGIPEVAIGPMLRHELEHARRWERSGTSFFEADDLPSLRPDVVEATLAALSARDDRGLGMSAAERVVYLGAVRTACATWDATVARSLTAGRPSPALELVPPVSYVS